MFGQYIDYICNRVRGTLPDVYIYIYIYIPGDKAPGRQACPTTPHGGSGAPGRSRELSDAHRESPKTAPENTQTSTCHPQLLKMPPSRSKRPPRRPTRASRGVPREPQEAKIVNFHLYFRCFVPRRFFSVPTLQDRPRGSQNGFKTTPGGRKRAPRRPNTASRRPKSRPRELKMAPRRPEEGPKRGNTN